MIIILSCCSLHFVILMLSRHAFLLIDTFPFSCSPANLSLCFSRRPVVHRRPLICCTFVSFLIYLRVPIWDPRVSDLEISWHQKRVKCHDQQSTGWCYLTPYQLLLPYAHLILHSLGSCSPDQPAASLVSYYADVKMPVIYSNLCHIISKPIKSWTYWSVFFNKFLYSFFFLVI